MRRRLPHLAALLVVAAALLGAHPAWAKKPKSEAAKPDEPADPKATAPTVAVLYFDVLAAADSGLDVLRKGLAQMLVADLADEPALRLVERDRLEALIAEQKMQRSKGFDSRTAVRFGKLLGARYVILGTVTKLGATVQIAARAVSVETGQILWAVSARGKDDDFFAIEGELATRIREKLTAGLPPIKTTAVKRKQRRRPKKLSIQTATRYAQALDAKDRGDKAAARAGMEKVVAEAPDFDLAYVDLQSMTN